MPRIPRFPAALPLWLGALALAGSIALPARAQPSLRIVEGLGMPESVLAHADGSVVVTEIGEFGKAGDGRLTAIDVHGNRKLLAQGLDDPKGLAEFGGAYYIADVTRVVRVDAAGRVEVLAGPEDFPAAPRFLNDVVIDDRGQVYVSDSGDAVNGGHGAIYRITPQGEVSLLISEAQDAAIRSPNGLLFDGQGGLLVADFSTGELLRVDLASRAVKKLGDGFGGGDGLARDDENRLYISDWKNGRVWQWDYLKAGTQPRLYPHPFQAAADLALSPDQRFVLVPDMKAGLLVWLPK